LDVPNNGLFFNETVDFGVSRFVVDLPLDLGLFLDFVLKD